MAGRQASITVEAAEEVARIDHAEGRAPLLLVCEHASNHLPDAYGTLGLTPAERESHIAWDPGALAVARQLARRLDAPLVHASVSRILLDLNREPGAPDSIAVLSERTPIPGNLELAESERAHRVRTIYEPFHAAVDAFLRDRPVGTRAVVSIHSFTPVYRNVVRPWHVGLIHDADDRLARFVAAGLSRDPALVVGLNVPYTPADRVFHTLERHAVRRGLAPLMIEIRNDLIGEPDQQESWGSRLAPLIGEAVGTV
jgi:predicted N-formylglutamate amidohydrolase